MSYNASAFHIKECNLVVSMRDLFRPGTTLRDAWGDSVDVDIYPTRFNATPETPTTIGIDLAENCELLGNYIDEENSKFLVKEIYYSGEFSGSNWESFKQLLFLTTGVLKAVVVWEDGDSFEMLEVKDGVVETGEFEIEELLFAEKGE